MKTPGLIGLIGFSPTGLVKLNLNLRPRLQDSFP